MTCDRSLRKLSRLIIKTDRQTLGHLELLTEPKIAYLRDDNLLRKALESPDLGEHGAPGGGELRESGSEHLVSLKENRVERIVKCL